MMRVSEMENESRISFDEERVMKMWKTTDSPPEEIWNYDELGSLMPVSSSTPANDCT